METPRADVACRFVRRKCKHDELFLGSYLRTNRTNHTKIMRCFPHCCPGHRKRSYCGSPLYVQLDQALPGSTARPLATGDLAVYARFRPVSVTPLRVGERVALATIHASLQQDYPSKGEWIEAELSHTSANGQDGLTSWVFEINASSRWYYPWSGAATIALRATEHVFEVLVFRRTSIAGELEILAEATSSKFKLMSFRRGVASGTANAAVVEVANGAAQLKDEDMGISSDGSARASPPRRLPATKAVAKTETLAKKRSHTDHSPLEHPQTRLSPRTVKYIQIESLHRAPSPTSSAAPLPALSAAVFSPSTTRNGGVSRLDALIQWLQELPMSSGGSRRLREWEQVVLEACTAHRTAAYGDKTTVRRELLPSLSTLNVSPTVLPINVSASPLDVIDATMRTLLHLFLDVDCCRMSSMAFTTLLNEHDAAGRSQLEASHRAWSFEIERRASRFADSCTRASWSILMGMVPTLRGRHQQLASDDAFAYRSFVALSRERYTQQQLQHVEAARARKHQRMTMMSIVALADVDASKRAFSRDSRVWVSRIEDVSVEMEGMAQHSLTLLTVLQFWRHLSCLRIELETVGQFAQLSLAAVFNTSLVDACFTKLTLDGHHRWFHSLPSGDATAGTTLMGYVMGDYVGSATSAGTLHVTTFMWPSETTTAGKLAYAWHWTLDATSLATGSTVVSVIIESACIQRAGSFETMAITDKLRSISRWDHLCQAQLAYQAQ